MPFHWFKKKYIPGNPKQVLQGAHNENTEDDFMWFQKESLGILHW